MRIDDTIPAAPKSAARTSARCLAKYAECPAYDWDGTAAPSIYDLLAYELTAPSARWESSLDLDLGDF